MQRVTTTHPHPTRLSPVQPRFLATAPEPMTLQRLGCPRPRRDLPSSLGVAEPPGEVPRSRRAWLCAPGWDQARSQASPLPARPTAAAAPWGFAQRGTRGICSERTRRQEILAMPGHLSHASLGPHCPGKLCQTFPPALSWRWLNPPPRPRRAWNQRTV